MKKARLKPPAIGLNSSSQEDKLDDVETKRSRRVGGLIQPQPLVAKSVCGFPLSDDSSAGPVVQQEADVVVDVDGVTSNEVGGTIQKNYRTSLLSVLVDVTRALTSSRNLEDILDCIAQAATRLLTADVASIRLVDRSNGECTIEAASGFLTPGFGRGTRAIPEERPAGWIIDNQKHLIIRDMFGDKDLAVRELADQEKVASYLGVPLLNGGTCIGVIEVYSRRESRQFNRRDIQRLTALGNQAVVAIENSRLYQTELDTATKLQQLERHKSDFMAMVAHELRTPLTSIKGFAQLLQRQNTCSNSDAAGRYLGIIEAESNRMMGIINDILDISKMEAGLLQMCKYPLSMSELINAIVDSAGYLSRGHIIELNVPESLPLIRGDAAKIGQVLINLISNAVKYSPEDEPIQIGATADDEGVTVWVNDRGRGIPADKFDHIFNKYRIADGDKDVERSKRSGLGLYISKNFVEAHGGKMWVESEEGKGAKFLFKLYY